MTSTAGDSLFSEAEQPTRDHGCGVLLIMNEMQFLPKDHFTALIIDLPEVSQLNPPIMVTNADLARPTA